MPYLNALSMLLVIFPLTFISGTFRIHIYSSTISFIIDPLTFIDISVDVVEFSLPESMTVIPLTFIDSSIGPFHDSAAMSKTSNPFSFIDCPIFILVCLFELFLAHFEKTMKGLFCLIFSKIFTLDLTNMIIIVLLLFGRVIIDKNA
jgi:hypothetical protein